MIVVKTAVELMKPIILGKDIDVFEKAWESPNKFPQGLNGSLVNKGRYENKLSDKQLKTPEYIFSALL